MKVENYLLYLSRCFKIETGGKDTINIKLTNDMGQILTRHGEKGELAKLFNTSRVTVRKALKGQNHSKFADRIRKAALERGGKETD